MKRVEAKAEIHTKFWPDNLKEREHTTDTDIHERTETPHERVY